MCQRHPPGGLLKLLIATSIKCARWDDVKTNRGAAHDWKGDQVLQHSTLRTYPMRPPDRRTSVTAVSNLAHARSGSLQTYTASPQNGKIWHTPALPRCWLSIAISLAQSRALSLPHDDCDYSVRLTDCATDYCTATAQRIGARERDGMAPENSKSVVANNRRTVCDHCRRRRKFTLPSSTCLLACLLLLPSPSSLQPGLRCNARGFYLYRPPSPINSLDAGQLLVKQLEPSLFTDLSLFRNPL